MSTKRADGARENQAVNARARRERERKKAVLARVPLEADRERIGTSEWSVVRTELSEPGSGVHTLLTTDERGLWVQIGAFGAATSHYYPAGLNLKLLSPPPVVPLSPLAPP